MHLALYDVGTCVWSCPFKDVSPTEITLNGKPASCPELAGSCTCKDASSTGIRLGGKPASCTQLKSFCTHSSHGPAVRQKCPLTCSTCDTKTSKLVREKCPATCNSWPTEIKAGHLNCTGTKRYMPSDFSSCSHATILLQHRAIQTGAYLESSWRRQKLYVTHFGSCFVSLHT